jgi:hypothetical protein
MSQQLTVQRIGPFTVGEVPLDLQITFKDDDGNVVNLTGYTAVFVIEKVDETDATVGTGTATISDEANGITNYAWVAADFDAAGQYRTQMWVNNSSTGKTLASDVFEYFVRPGTTRPTF